MDAAVSIDHALSWIGMHPRRPHVMPVADEHCRWPFAPELADDPANPGVTYSCVEQVHAPRDRLAIGLGGPPCEPCDRLAKRVAPVSEGHPRLRIGGLLGLRP